ncbi:putative Cystatin domain-containing protein [Rosa chinensis]|uniref:Putative Cystatin domain-containing protein n=1 Tax=Rosa chinensis TaxID=74649 RepID=A0A2P6RXG6_ROSCH|nr:putative Cystatin domain-containing protein [Rosa chinensis]
MSPHYLVAILALLFPLLTAAVDKSGDSAPLGAWTPLKNISDPQVTEIAKYAVKVYNSQNHKNLIFQKVIKGYYQIESGRLYKLDVRVKDEKSVQFPTTDYQAIVLTRGSFFKKLVSFRQISN